MVRELPIPFPKTTVREANCCSAESEIRAQRYAYALRDNDVSSTSLGIEFDKDSVRQPSVLLGLPVIS